MPHIKTVVDYYYSGDLDSEYAKSYGIKTRAEMVNIGFKYWGHQWLYDEEELERRLKEAGFSQMESKKSNESQFQLFQNLETRSKNSNLIYEAVKE